MVTRVLQLKELSIAIDVGIRWKKGLRYDELLKTGGVAGMVVGLLPVAFGLLIQVLKARQVAITSTLVTPLRDSATTLFVDFEDASVECLMLSRMRCTASLAGSISQV